MIVFFTIKNVNIHQPAFALVSLFIKDYLIEKIIHVLEKRSIFAS